ncbi:MAG: hypothetical protein V3R95_02235 [Dehalococcoidia bacterium]
MSVAVAEAVGATAGVAVAEAVGAAAGVGVAEAVGAAAGVGVAEAVGVDVDGAFAVAAVGNGVAALTAVASPAGAADVVAASAGCDAVAASAVPSTVVSPGGDDGCPLVQPISSSAATSIARHIPGRDAGVRGGVIRASPDWPRTDCDELMLAPPQ